MTKSAAIYARVSTSDQLTGTSLDSQVKTCREYAQQKGYRIVEEGVIAEDISGTVFDRPGMLKLNALAARKEISAVILAKVDRLARSRVVDALLEAELRSYGVEVLYVNRDTSSTQGRLLVNIEKDFAEWEREVILERTWNGKLERARQGGVMASRSAPYGYEFVVTGYRTAGRRTVPIRELAVLESEAQWVRKIYDWLVNEHYSLGEIIRRLNDQSVPTKSGKAYWQRTTIHNVLSNSVYVGDWYWNKRQLAEPRTATKPERVRGTKSSYTLKPQDEWIHIGCPAIVTHEVYEAARCQLQHNKDRAGRPGTRLDLLRRMLFCSWCKRRLIGRSIGSVAKGTYMIQYMCSARQLPGTHDTCRCPYLTAHKIERKLWDKLSAYLTNEEIITALLAEREQDREHEWARDQAQMQGVIEDEQRLKRERDKLIDMHVAEPPLIDRDTLQERLAALDKRQAEATATRRAIEERVQGKERTQTNQTMIKQMCALARLGFPQFSEEDKRALFEAVELRGTVERERIVFDWVLGEPLILLLGKQTGDTDEELYKLS